MRGRHVFIGIEDFAARCLSSVIRLSVIGGETFQLFGGKRNGLRSFDLNILVSASRHQNESAYGKGESTHRSVITHWRDGHNRFDSGERPLARFGRLTRPT